MPNHIEKHDTWVLFIEDDTDLRMTVSLILQERGLKVLGAANGAEAVKILVRAIKDDHLPSVIITNLTMPIFSGWEILELFDVVINPKLKRIPIIIASGERMMLDPKYRIIKKPYSEEQLMAEIEAAMNHPKEG